MAIDGLTSRRVCAADDGGLRKEAAGKHTLPICKRRSTLGDEGTCEPHPTRQPCCKDCPGSKSGWGGSLKGHARLPSRCNPYYRAKSTTIRPLRDLFRGLCARVMPAARSPTCQSASLLGIGLDRFAATKGIAPMHKEIPRVVVLPEVAAVTLTLLQISGLPAFGANSFYVLAYARLDSHPCCSLHSSFSHFRNLMGS